MVRRVRRFNRLGVQGKGVGEEPEAWLQRTQCWKFFLHLPPSINFTVNWNRSPHTSFGPSWREVGFNYTRLRHWTVSTSFFSPNSFSHSWLLWFPWAYQRQDCRYKHGKPRASTLLHARTVCLEVKHIWITFACPLLWKTAALLSSRRLKSDLRNLKSDLFLSKHVLICSWTLFRLLHLQVPVSLLTANYLFSPAARPSTPPSS